jgi:hypothetical protein
MATFTLPKTIQKLLVIGPVYNKLAKLDEVEKLLGQYDWIVFNDGITFYRNKIEEVIPQIDKMDQLLSSNKVIYNAGSIDITTASKMDILQSNQSKIEQWVRKHPNVVIADFGGSFRTIILSGGIPPNIIKLDQLNYPEVSFITHPHETYTGGLGYVITNSPFTQWTPKFYRFSVQIGNVPEGHVYALEVDRNGIQRTILI